MYRADSLHFSSKEAALRFIRDYFRGDPENERGCFLTNDWEVITFKNISKTPRCHIALTVESVCLFHDLLLENRIYGWVHSHPHYPALPSSTDLRYHRFPCNMLIYSLSDRCFTDWSASDIVTMRNDLLQGREVSFDPGGTGVYKTINEQYENKKVKQ